ncbi:hypothetical protein CYMTET_45114 [Cymbomonas tetramitiformis]|uniref:Uncharacterized protein n=1 Tax=Cymbomonas tetramitiformis TaxID=36881 RepID=A0AAE0C0X7_9CHLO|nr:hypothetical protein CYMTET_45114 [Cymbomonas tetramitiformis]
MGNQETTHRKKGSRACTKKRGLGEEEEVTGNTWPEGTDMQQMQENELALHQMEQEEETALMLAQNPPGLQQEEGVRETTQSPQESAHEDVHDESPPETERACGQHKASSKSK